MTKRLIASAKNQRSARARRLAATPRQHFTISLTRQQIEALRKTLWGPSCVDPVITRIYERLTDILIDPLT